MAFSLGALGALGARNVHSFGTLRAMSVHDTYTFLHEGDLHVSYGSRIFLKKVDFDIIVHNLNAVEKKLISASPRAKRYRYD